MLKLQLFAAIAFVLIACCFAAAGRAATAAAVHPNIVVILADDMGYGDVKCNYPRRKNSHAAPRPVGVAGHAIHRRARPRRRSARQPAMP